MKLIMGNVQARIMLMTYTGETADRINRRTVDHTGRDTNPIQ